MLPLVVVKRRPESHGLPRKTRNLYDRPREYYVSACGTWGLHFIIINALFLNVCLKRSIVSFYGLLFSEIT